MTILPRRPLIAAGLPALLPLRRAAAQGQGDRLVIGTKLDPSSMDPHYFNGTENTNAHAHIFEALLGVSAAGRVTPALAEAWEATGRTSWRFRLRREVRFHDGSPFTARDVLYSIARVPRVANSPGPFTAYVRNIDRIEAPDDHTILIETKAPDPFLPRDLARVLIIPASLGDAVRTADFNAGRATIGTGPYRLASFASGERLVFARNETYWGPRAPWREVVLRIIRSDASRAAALLANELDMMDFPAVADVGGFARRPNLAVVREPGARIMYVQMDHDREVSPFAAGPDGKNPLRDVRVRRALSIGVDRQALVERVLDGAGAPAGQMAAPGQPGGAPDLRAPAYDPARARALLAEAGVARGFRLTIHGTSDRYPGGDRVVQTLAQFYSRLGIDVSVQLVPNAAFFPQASRRDYSFFFLGYGADDVSVYLRTVLHSFDADRNLGSSNRGRYANPRVDELVRACMTEMDDARREALMSQAFALAEGEDVAVISLYYPTYDYVVLRGRLDYTVHTLGYTWAMLARPPGG